MDSELGQADLAALGRIALISTGIQMIIELMIWELLGVEEVAGRTITDKTTPSWLVDRLKRLAKRSNLEPSLASEIVEFAQASKTIVPVADEDLSHGAGLAQVVQSYALQRQVEPIADLPDAPPRLVDGPPTVYLFPWEQHHAAHLVR